MASSGGMIEEAALSERLKTCAAGMFEKYEQLKSGTAPAGSIPFWDMIVLTATDEAQATSYSAQLTLKQELKEIPAAKYHVFADPPGPKIGNGGATLFALEQLEALYGAELDSAKVLLIHAGGFSTRLPNVSVIGKIFAALPFGNPVYTMLEMKLAAYIDFPTRMAPGVFVTCADDIELLDPTGDLHFLDPGFTALGHPSSLEIGTTHGVFVIEEASRKAVVDQDRVAGLACRNAVCERFLHKPSVPVMQAAGAPTGEDEVYTDSAFFFDRPTAKSLLAFWDQAKPLTCEIDAYGDFLQALGPKATADYTGNSANVISESDELSRTRLALYEHLKGTQLNVTLCNWSKFYHIGTLPEYLFHYCTDPSFSSEMGCSSKTFSSVASEALLAPGSELCFIHSKVGSGVSVGSQTVLEYSTIGDGAKIGARCLVSAVTLPPAGVIPDATFMHTTCVEGGFCTIVFGTKEDLKSAATPELAGTKLTFCNTPLDEAFARLKLDLTAVWPAGGKKLNLWGAKLYPVFQTAEESATFAAAVSSVAQGITAELPGGADFAGLPRLGMADIITSKDLGRFMELRSVLRAELAEACK